MKIIHSLFNIKWHVIYTNKKFPHTLLNKYWTRHLRNIFIWRLTKLFVDQRALASPPAWLVLARIPGLSPAQISRPLTSLCCWESRVAEQTCGRRSALLGFTFLFLLVWLQSASSALVLTPLPGPLCTVPWAAPHFWHSPKPSDSCPLAPLSFVLPILLYVNATLSPSAHLAQFVSGLL